MRVYATIVLTAGGPCLLRPVGFGMLTVSLIGVDGVGKTTVAQRVESDFPVPIKYLYMGANIEASNYTLPTTRWWKMRRGHGRTPHRRGPIPQPAPAGSQRDGAAPRTTVRVSGLRALRPVRKALGFLNRVAEELYRARVVARYRRQGYVVLLDRHFVLDYYHEDHGPHAHARSLKRRMQGFLRQRVHPLPELVICLDIDGKTAYRRKGEFSPTFLDARRRQYLELRSVVPEFVVVDARQELDTVVEEVRAAILRRCERMHDERASA